MKKCQYCAEEIQDEAIKCRYCGSEIAAAAQTTAVVTPAVRVAMEEKVYYSDGSITVTSTRAVLAGKTYAMANVTSVSLGENKAGAGCGAILALIGGVLSLAIFGGLDTIVVGIVGILLLVGGVILLRVKTYVVRIGSASGEANALDHKDREYIQKIVDALSQAIIDRR